MPMSVGPLPEDYRKAWHVRFAYGMYYQDGQFAPCGYAAYCAGPTLSALVRAWHRRPISVVASPASLRLIASAIWNAQSLGLRPKRTPRAIARVRPSPWGNANSEHGPDLLPSPFPSRGHLQVYFGQTCVASATVTGNRLRYICSQSTK